jgi:diguanylate cyclase (GGDEF)-like protein
MMERCIRILLIEDNRADAMLIREILKESKAISFELVHVSRLSEGLKQLRTEPFGAVLLDLNLPDSEGIDTFLQTRAHAPDVPIVILTGLLDESLGMQAVQEGAQDYLVKGHVDGNLISKSILYAIERHRFMALLRGLSILDELTGLFNRRHMIALVEEEFRRASRYGTDLSCLMIDLDLFKGINDTFGHAFGDLVLREFGASLKKQARISDSCFRYGGEEFMVLLPQTDIVGASRRAERIRELCEKKEYKDGTSTSKVTVSIGIASLGKHHPAQARDLLAYADKALYRAKAEGRNRVNVYLEDSFNPFQTATPQGVRDINHLKERLAAILDKTKRAAIASLELMVKDMADSRLQDRRHKVQQYLDFLGGRLRLPPSIIETMRRAASLHDCFSVLLENQLNNSETTLEDHPFMLVELTEIFDFFSNERSVLLYHHENYDGSGYPEGLQGNGIPLGARLFAIADALAASSSSDNAERPPKEKIKELEDHAGTRFDPLLVRLITGE